MSGDNFHFDLTGVPLDLCLRVAFGNHSAAVGWSIEEGITFPTVKRMVLYWTTHIDMTPFPGKLDAVQIEPIIRAWLEEKERYGPQPDHDGDNSKGWRVYNEAWGHVGKKWEAFVAIEPVWIMYGK